MRDALAEALGDDWTFSVSGHGEEKPRAKETGSDGEIEAARARNRRVEVTVSR